jgi:ACS family tartrate transporter-like MFS transporter
MSAQTDTQASWRGPIGDSAFKKCRKHILPLLIIFYILAYIGRSNLGYASLTMNEELGITAAAYGLVAGIFFIGYFIFEVPSNIIMDKVGARKWIARILISWGIIVVIMGGLQNVTQLYILRFLLGVAEAGFFPGVILYLSRWFLGRDSAKAISMFMLAIPISYMIGAPLSGAISDNVFWLGLSSWRWIFILEGIPSIIGGIVCLKILPDKPDSVSWLTDEEKTWLDASLKEEAARKPVQAKKYFSKEAFFNARMWLLLVVYFAVELGEYGLGFWTPLIINDLGAGLSATTVGFLTALTYVFGAVALYWNGNHSDKVRERKWHCVVPLLLCAVAMSTIGNLTGSMWAVVMLAIIIASVYALFGPFWSLTDYYLTGPAAAVGIAMVNSFGNLAGFVSPTLIGVMKESTGQDFSGFYIIGICMVVAAVLIAVFVKNKELRAVEYAADEKANAENYSQVK